MAGHPDNAPKSVSVLGIIGLVFGGFGLLIAFVPLLGFLGMPLSLVGLILAVIGLALAASSGRTGVALPVVALVISGVALAMPWIVTTYFVKAGLDAVNKGVEAEKKEAKEADDKVRNAADAIKISAADLVKAYSPGGGQDAADAKYKGKVLEISDAEVKTVGQVIELLGVGTQTLTLKGANGDSIECQFSSLQKEDLAKLKPGDKITVRGKGDGAFVGSPRLKTCVLVQ